MAYERTTIFRIPADSTAKAEILKEFNDLINGNTMEGEAILMVILGKSDTLFKEGEGGIEDTRAVPTADRLTYTSPMGFPRWVIYIPDRTVLKDELEPYLHEAGHINDTTPYEKIKAFCLTIQSPRKANSRVYLTSVLDFTELEGLFTEAEEQSV